MEQVAFDAEKLAPLTRGLMARLNAAGFTFQYLSGAYDWAHGISADDPSAGCSVYPFETLQDAIIDAACQYPTIAAEVARAFCSTLADWLKPEEIAEAVKRNAAEKSPDVCHTHDFCDANEAMAEAMKSVGFPEPAIVCTENEALCKLWDAAWDLAKAAGFDPAKIKGVTHGEILDA